MLIKVLCMVVSVTPAFMDFKAFCIACGGHLQVKSSLCKVTLSTFSPNSQQFLKFYPFKNKTMFSAKMIEGTPRKNHWLGDWYTIAQFLVQVTFSLPRILTMILRFCTFPVFQLFDSIALVTDLSIFQRPSPVSIDIGLYLSVYKQACPEI